MTISVQGVVSRGKGQPVEVTEVLVPEPGPGEVLVKVQACGVCHTDLHYKMGGIGDDFPYLLGHEAVDARLMDACEIPEPDGTARTSRGSGPTRPRSCRDGGIELARRPEPPARLAADTDTGGGLNVLVGLAHREGLFTELKLGLGDSPDVKFAVGYTFRR